MSRFEKYKDRVLLRELVFDKILYLADTHIYRKIWNEPVLSVRKMAKLIGTADHGFMSEIYDYLDEMGEKGMHPCQHPAMVGTHCDCIGECDFYNKLR